MRLEDAIGRLVPGPVEAVSLADAYGLTLNVYPRSSYALVDDWLIVGDDAADKIGAAVDGSGLFFLRADGARFVNSTLALLRRFASIYLEAHERHARLDREEADLDVIGRRFSQLDPPSMAETATWFNFLDMIRNYP